MYSFGKHIHPNGFDIPCLMFKRSFANIVNLVQDKDHHQVNGINGLYQRHYANIPLYKVKCGSSYAYLWQVCSIGAFTPCKNWTHPRPTRKYSRGQKKVVIHACMSHRSVLEWCVFLHWGLTEGLTEVTISLATYAPSLSYIIVFCCNKMPFVA